MKVKEDMDKMERRDKWGTLGLQKKKKNRVAQDLFL